MYVQIGEPPQADFTKPLELMKDCHRRVEHFLKVLILLVRQTKGGPLSDEDRRALQTALDYFRGAAPRHHEDEEISLFPRIIASRDPRAIEGMTRIKALEAEHLAAEPNHQRIDEIGRYWLGEGRISSEQLRELNDRLIELTALYQHHIHVEDTIVMPLAGEILSAEEIAAIGREMAERRGLNPGRPDSKCGQRRRQQLQPQPGTAADEGR